MFNLYIIIASLPYIALWLLSLGSLGIEVEFQDNKTKEIRTLVLPTWTKY